MNSNKKSIQFFAQKILSLLDESDIDEFQTLQQNDVIKGGGIATDANFKVFQMKLIVEDVLIRHPELKIKYKTKNKLDLITIMDQLQKDGYLKGYNFKALPTKNPRNASVGDILKKFGKKKLNEEEQEAFLKEFEKNPKYSNIYEGIDVDIRTGQKIKPLQHQKQFIQQFSISNLRGVIAFHGVGSGKTLTAVISSYYFLKLYPDRKVIVISPSALLFNFLQGMIQYGLEIRDNRYQFFTYDKYIRNPVDTTGCLVIVDEAHNFRTEIKKAMEIDSTGELVEVVKTNKRGFKISETATKQCFKVILLSGTVFVNKIYDIENLLAMVDNREPLSEGTFTDAITNPSNLSSYFDYKVSYYERGDDNNFPTRKSFIEPLYMTKEQEDEYEDIRKNGPPPEIIKKFGQIPRETEKPNSFYAAEQFASNYITDENGINPKVKFVMNLIITRPTQKFIIYSSFLNTGIFNLVGHLKKVNLPNTKPVFITGKETPQQKEESKRLFNNFVIPKSDVDYLDGNNDYRILFITKAGAEGVDTKNCQNIILFDELWNDATAEQVIARAIRFKSHQELAPKERYVNVIRLLFLKESDKDLVELILEENPQFNDIDEKIRERKEINSNIENGLTNNKIKALPNFNMQDFKLISGTVPKADTGDKEGQKKRRDKIRQLENIYLTKVEKDFKNGVNGFKILFTEQKNKDDFIKKYTVITTAYGKKNLHRPVPSLNEVEKTEFFDKDEYKKASRLNQGDVYLIQVKETIEIQNRKAVLSDDFLSGIQRDEPLSLPCVDMYKFILSKSKEQRINYFIENFGNKISLFEKYESKYRKQILQYVKDSKEELTGELELKLMKSIVSSEKEAVADILWTNIQKNKIEEHNKRTKAEKLQQFYTPPEVSYELVDAIFEKIENMDDLKILEPTAGEGGLLIPFIKPRNKKLIDYNKTDKFNISLVEIDKDNRNYLKSLVDKGDTFLDLEDQPNFLKFDTSTRYNIIITNPPFHLRKNENQGLTRDVWDVDFLIKCCTLLKIGGVIGAIIGKASEKNKDINLLKEVGTVKIKDIGKRKFGTILTPVLFLIFTKKSDKYDDEFRKQISSLYAPQKDLPNYLEQPVSLVEPPKN